MKQRKPTYEELREVKDWRSLSMTFLIILVIVVSVLAIATSWSLVQKNKENLALKEQIDSMEDGWSLRMECKDALRYYNKDGVNYRNVSKVSEKVFYSYLEYKEVLEIVEKDKNCEVLP